MRAGGCWCARYLAKDGGVEGRARVSLAAFSSAACRRRHRCIPIYHLARLPFVACRIVFPIEQKFCDLATRHPTCTFSPKHPSTKSRTLLGPCDPPFGSPNGSPPNHRCPAESNDIRPARRKKRCRRRVRQSIASRRIRTRSCYMHCLRMSKPGCPAFSHSVLSDHAERTVWAVH